MSLLYRILTLRYRKSARLYTRPPRQEHLLLELLQRNRNSAYGKAYGFSDIHSEQVYRQRVPLVSYDDLHPYMQRIRAGEPGVLTEEEVVLLEPTGGSGGLRKWIPYTRTLKQQFQWGVEAWLYDIYTQYPGVNQGKAYWMITPPFTREEWGDAPVPVGFNEDADYLGSFGKMLVKRIMVQPEITPGMTTEEFYLTTLRALAKEKNLRLLSIWNPSLLMNLLDYAEEFFRSIQKYLPAARQKALDKAVKMKDYQYLWPNLRLISCWADAAAKPEAERLAARIPYAIMQPKGLLSTESMVSFPTRESLARGGMVPAYAGTYLEFLTEDGIRSLDELVENRTYEVVTTTGGGLYRYRTGDRVRVTGRLGEVPLLRFEGRINTVDLVGEKLTPEFVERVFSHLSGFYLLTPAGKGYVLYTDTPISPGEGERCLAQNHHYQLARRLGQLQPLRIFLIQGDAKRQYFDNCRRFGQRLGDIKPIHLSPRTDFLFTGAFYD